MSDPEMTNVTERCRDQAGWVHIIACVTLSCLPSPALAASLPAMPQERPGSTAKSEDIVVTGDPDQDSRVRDFIRSLTPPNLPESLPRFDGARWCPVVFGLGEAYDRAIVARMRRVAAAVKIELAPEDCHDMNAIVIFAANKDMTVRALNKRYSWLFTDERHDLVRIRTEAEPVAAWHVTGKVDREGVPLKATLDGQYELTTIDPGSRITTQVRPVYRISVVVIERSGLAGLTVTQIADYAAMRALTDADPAKARATGAPTILTALDGAGGREVPQSLTTWDLSFMHGLYTVLPNSYAAAQRGQIKDTMKRQLAGGTLQEKR